MQPGLGLRVKGLGFRFIGFRGLGESTGYEDPVARAVQRVQTLHNATNHTTTPDQHWSAATCLRLGSAGRFGRLAVAIAHCRAYPLDCSVERAHGKKQV